MFGSQTGLGVLVLVTSIAVFSQNNDTKAPDAGVVAASRTTVSIAANPCASQKRPERAEVLTDTEGVDFDPYLRRVAKIVQQNWHSVLLLSAYPLTNKEARLSIEFVVQKDGKVDKMRIDTPSGDRQLDRVAWASITSSSPLPRLPEEFRGQSLGLRLNYFYNAQPDAAPIYITPCVDVRVLAGSTLQFSVPIGGIERAAVKWSVSGPACEEAACGTISENGLYTAPARVPDPPTVFVKATPPGNLSLPARTRLTVVQGSPSH